MSCQQVPTTPAFNPYPRSVQVGEFEVAITGGIWVAIRVEALLLANFDSPAICSFWWAFASTIEAPIIGVLPCAEAICIRKLESLVLEG